MLSYYVLDVFTVERYQGNPLSVVYLQEELALSDYQKIAREFGYSETSFIYYPPQADTFTVRSFTPAGVEVNGAGHNLLGAVCLALQKDPTIFSRQQNNPWVMMATHPIRLSIAHHHQLPLVGMLQKPAVLLNEVPTERVAAALSLQPEDLLVQDWKPTIVATEVAHLMIPISSSEKLNQAVSQKELVSRLAQAYGFEGCYLFTLLHQDVDYIAESRFFNPGIGIDEDAATGTAAGPLAGFLLEKKHIEKARDYAIWQGVKMGHPSTIHVRVEDEGIWVGGSAILVMEGSLYL